MCLRNQEQQDIFEAEVLISAQPQSSKDRAGSFWRRRMKQPC